MDFRLGNQYGDQENYQNLIACSFCHPRPLHRISSQSIQTFLSNVATRQTERQIKTTENTTIFPSKYFSNSISGLTILLDCLSGTSYFADRLVKLAHICFDLQTVAHANSPKANCDRYFVRVVTVLISRTLYYKYGKYSF